MYRSMAHTSKRPRGGDDEEDEVTTDIEVNIILIFTFNGIILLFFNF